MRSLTWSRRGRAWSARSIALSSLLLSSLSCTLAVAAEPSPDKLIEEGLDLREQHRDEEALQRFQKAYEIKPTPRAIAQVALAEQALGRWLDAARDLDKALAAADDEWIKPRLPLLKQARGVIDQHVGQLEVRCNIAGAELWVGAERVGVLPMKAPVRVEAGTAQVQVRAEGYGPATRAVTITAGRLSRESFKLAELTAAPLLDGVGGEGAAPDPRAAELRPLRRKLRKVLYAGVAGGYGFYLPTLGFGIRRTVHPRIDITARADLGLFFNYNSNGSAVVPGPGGVGTMVVPVTTYQLGPVLGVDGTVRLRPLSESSMWYVGVGLTLKFGLTFPVGDNSGSVVASSSGFLVPFGGIVETGVLLGKREQWDLGLRFEGGLSLLSGFLCVGYAL